MNYLANGSNMNSERMWERGVKYNLRIHAVLRGFCLRFNKIIDSMDNEVHL